MQDRRGADGVEHLQAAARELLGAARAFLDVVEQVVEDPDRMSGAASAVGDLVRSGLGGVRDQPWERAAWGDGTDDDSDDDSDDGFGRVRPDGWWDESDDAPEPEPEPEPEAAAVKKSTAKKASPARKAPAKVAPSSRVRRISVD